MYFKEHNKAYRELFDPSGNVIAYWTSSSNTWRECFDKCYFEDWEIYGYESGSEEINCEGDIFSYTVQGL